MTTEFEMEHRLVRANGIRIHGVELGTGPLVILVHGFPESWYSWRYQLPALAEAGYRAFAIDVRGYGRSGKPNEIEAYRMLEHVADLVGVVDALGEQQAILIGHDWGAPIVWNSALLRPDLFRAVCGISVPYSPRASIRPSDAFRALGGDEEFYIEYFQEPGKAEAEIEEDVREWLLGFYYTASGDDPGGPLMSHREHGKKLKDRFRFPQEMPAWMTEDDLDVYSSEFEHSGFRGGLKPVPQRGSGLARSGGVAWPPDRGSLDVHWWQQGWADSVGCFGDFAL